MKPYYEAEAVTLYLGDCIEVMRTLPEASVDAVVCDPPYGLEFMGKAWDSFAPDRKNATVWDGRRAASEGWESHAESRSGRGGGGPQYASKHRGAKRCQKCGHRSFSGTPCVCLEPEWVLEYQQSAPSAMLAFQSWSEAWAREAYRVLKPGGHLAAFGGTRTYHRLASGVEDAGFEIRDALAWMYGQGFPKSLDVSKAIDKAAGAEREVIGRAKGAVTQATESLGQYAPEYDVTIPATADAVQWAGWGTALKPAYEPIVLARKPLSGTVAANVLAHGTGALNIDASRIGYASDADKDAALAGDAFKRKDTSDAGWSRPWMDDPVKVAALNAASKARAQSGRWPANVLLDEAAAALLDATVGELTSGKMMPTHTDAVRNTYGQNAAGGYTTMETYGDRGGPSRFFYTAKSSRSEREAGLEALPPNVINTADPPGTLGANSPRAGAGRLGERHNSHPTVKPVSLMRWLCTLVTPPGGTILDPFLGSGSTCLGALDAGFRFVGIEQDEHYLDTARTRITHRHLLEVETRESNEDIPQGRLM